MDDYEVEYEISDIIDETDASFAMSQAAYAFILNFILGHGERSREQIIEWLRETFDNIPFRYTVNNDMVAHYYNLTLTPWDIYKAVLRCEGTEIGNRGLPVQVTIDNKVYEHLLSMDMAMGILLFSKVVQRDLHMTMYGKPLTYFNPDEDDIYVRGMLVDVACPDSLLYHRMRHREFVMEGEYQIQMVGSDRKYTFRGDEFLQGIKTAAAWLGLDHHEYWTSLIDHNDTALTF